MTETWRAVPGFEGSYEVSNLGRVRSLDRIVIGRTRVGDPLPRPHKGRLLSFNLHKHGYLLVHFWRDGERTATSVHAVVAAAFLGPCPAGKEVAHDDGVPANCALSNLRYDTKVGNLADKVRHGTQTRGETCPASKLLEIEVHAIRARRGETHQQIADEFGTSRGNVSRIRRGETWAHV